jgi:tetratricopeptide (TPR) repeat protein
MADASMTSFEMSEADTDQFKSEKDAGKVAFNEGQYDVAISHYTNALSISSLPQSDCAILLTNRALSHIRKAEAVSTQAHFHYTAALHDAKEALICSPSWKKAFYSKGAAYLELDKPEKALRGMSNKQYCCPLSVLIFRCRSVQGTRHDA